jgi:glycosyltransferase involved in cell wall biosynthesis
MEKKINIIQFMPYFPPHKWWVETVGEEIWKYWVKNNFWEFINVVSNFEQKNELEKNEKIIFEDKIIWYKKDWVEILVCPSIEIINNFPVYKFWSKKYRLIKKYLKLKIWKKNNVFRIITHTRFFLTSFIWWLFARKNKIKWIHIEHWSDYVKLSSKIKTKLSIIYDKTFWKWIFKKSDKILAISEACKNFINKEFVDSEVEVFYRWIEFPKNIVIKEDLKDKFKNKIIIWYIWRLYKWKNVENLIKAFYNLEINLQNKLKLVIVWDWEDFDRLKNLDIRNKIYFTWWQKFEDALSYQKQFDIHIHPSSPGWWLATTLLQAMNFWCIIVATPNEWAKEVITNNKNWFLLKNDSIEELEKWIILAINNLDKKESFSLENKKIIKEKFSWEENILKLYNFIK